jgi:hypothetical protein
MIRVGVEDVHPHGLERVRFLCFNYLREEAGEAMRV